MKIQQLAAITVLSACIAICGCQNSQGGGSGTQARTSASGPGVPKDARRVAEAANGARVIHRPLREGTVYVQDVKAGKVIYSGTVRANANVVIDPAANAVTVNDQQVKANTKLDPRGTYRLYFKQKS